MGAILDPDEIANAQRQIGGPTPAVPMAVGPGGAIVDPGELAHVKAQLSAPDVGAATPAAGPAPALLPQGPTSMGPVPDRGISGHIADAARMLFAPVMGARAAALAETATGTGLPNADYAKNLANEQNLARDASNAHPYAAQVLGGAGTIAPALGAAVMAPEEGVLGAATLGGRALYSALTGGAVGGVNAASREPDLTAPGVLPRVGSAATTGAVLGGLAPVAGAGIGAAYNAGANVIAGGADGISRAATSKLLPAIEADTPQAIQARLAALGPQAMLADSGPAMLGKAQGVALNSDEARSTLNGALLARDAGTNARLAGDVNSAIGPAMSPQAATNILQNARTQVHSRLPAIFASAPPVDTTGVLATIGQGLTTAVGPESTALARARDYLMRDGTDAAGNPIRVPIDDAQTLQNAKSAIDMMISGEDESLGVRPGALSRAQGAITNVRAQLNQALRDQVPGYSDVMDRSSALASRMEAIERGDSILNSGQNAVSPEDLERGLATRAAGGMGPISPVINELQGLRIGARGAIDRTMGTKANDLIALRNAMQGEGGWNTDKLATIFGDQPTADIASSIDRNSAFRGTLQNVVQNSQTAQRQAAAAAMKPGADTGGIPYINPNMNLTGAVMTPVKRMADALLSQFKADPTRSYGEIARVLSAQGPQRGAFASALVDAFNRRGANAVMAGKVGNMGSHAAMAAALIGNGMMNGQPPAQTNR